MKKRLVAILVVMMFAASAFAEIDLSGMTFAELVDLQKQVTMAMWETEDWQEVTVPAGAYQIGIDIPEGHWTIRPADGQTAELYWGAKLKKHGTEIDGNYIFEQITSPTDSYASYNNVESVSWTLTDGTYLVVDSSSVVFSPFAGVSLGFK